MWVEDERVIFVFLVYLRMVSGEGRFKLRNIEGDSVTNSREISRLLYWHPLSDVSALPKTL